MSSLRPLHRQAAQHFDERYKCKHTIWVSRHRTLRTQYLHLGIFFESSIKFLQVTKTFASYSFCLCTPLLTLTCLSFQAPTYLNCHLQKRLLLDEVFQ